MRGGAARHNRQNCQTRRKEQSADALPEDPLRSEVSLESDRNEELLLVGRVAEEVEPALSGLLREVVPSEHRGERLEG